MKERERDGNSGKERGVEGGREGGRGGEENERERERERERQREEEEYERGMETDSKFPQAIYNRLTFAASGQRRCQLCWRLRARAPSLSTMSSDSYEQGTLTGSTWTSSTRPGVAARRRTRAGSHCSVRWVSAGVNHNIDGVISILYQRM